MALQAYDDNHCPDCGQRLDLATDPALAEFWDTMQPIRDHACTAIAEAAKQNEGAEHRGALRYPVGMREGWEDRLAAARRERAAADHP